MYVLSDLRSNTDEDASRNVYQKCFSLSIYIYIYYIYIYIYFIYIYIYIYIFFQKLILKDALKLV